MDAIQAFEDIMDSCKNTKVIVLTGWATLQPGRQALVKAPSHCLAKLLTPTDPPPVLNIAPTLKLPNTNIEPPHAHTVPQTAPKPTSVLARRPPPDRLFLNMARKAPDAVPAPAQPTLSYPAG